MDEDTSMSAGHPFNDPDADLVLRASDGAQFRVFRVVLSLASPVFKDMFSVPQPPTTVFEGSPELPVVDLAEDRQTLDLLLRFCYPMEEPPLDALDDVRHLIAAGQKYDMVRPVAAGRRQLCQLAEGDPVGAWAVAVNRDLPHEARLAARQYLAQPMLSSTCNPYLSYVTGVDFHNLLSYWSACADVASHLAATKWVPDDWRYLKCPSTDCKTERTSHPRTPRDWWYEVMTAAVPWLKAAPRGSTMTSEKALKLCIKKGTRCSDCQDTVQVYAKRFLQEFSARIEEEINMVKLVL